jgi:hypothetical protein
MSKGDFLLFPNGSRRFSGGQRVRIYLPFGEFSELAVDPFLFLET